AFQVDPHQGGVTINLQGVGRQNRKSVGGYVGGCLFDVIGPIVMRGIDAGETQKSFSKGGSSGRSSVRHRRLLYCGFRRSRASSTAVTQWLAFLYVPLSRRANRSG